MALLKQYRLTILFNIIAIICLISFRLIGSSIDENGFLKEPFALIPLFWLFLLLSVITFITTLWRNNKRSKNEE